ncbi:MAG: hypothetical protein ABW252_19170 [Polyangiales bacterium]
MSVAPNFIHMLARRAYLRAHNIGFLRVFTYHARGTNEMLGMSLNRSRLYRIGEGRYTQQSGRCPKNPPRADAGVMTQEPAGSEVVRSPGCGQEQGLTSGTHTLRVGSAERQYVLSVPRDYDAERPYRVVFAFHGVGSDAQQAQRTFGLEQATGGQAVLVYPQAVDQQADVKSWGTSGPAADDDLALFDTLVAEVGDNLCVDQNHVFATGQSTGGFFANTLGCARGKTLRGIAPVGGGGPFVDCDGGHVAAFVIGAQDDRLVASAAVESSRDHWLRASGCTGYSVARGPSLCVDYEACNVPEHPVRFCLEQRGDQTWPTYGGQEIWKFFEGL